jgi:signal transduction histidine kinase
MMPFRSVGAKLSLALALLVALALGVAYLIVIPSLERRLVEAKLEQLMSSAAAAVQTFQVVSAPIDLQSLDLLPLQDFVDDTATAANARAVLVQPLASGGGALTVVQDSRPGTSRDLVTDQIALRAVATGTFERGVETRNDQEYAEVAVPLTLSPVEPTVLLLTAPIDDTLANVTVIERRLLVAGGAALLIAVSLGYALAELFARRIRRLQRGADRIASGELDEPVVDHSSDELGDLARAFERMRERLTQLEHARREFVANASHELRTPIFSLGGFVELLANEELDEGTRREFLATMQEQIERLTKLATDLLDLSRLDAGRFHVESEPLDLARIAETLAEEFVALASAREHRLAIDVEDDAAALGDETRVLQIGRILVENAIRHTAPGTSVRIVASADGGAPTLSVEDAGPGIPIEHQAHVFERFYRIEGNRASGSGLGLAIARELAEVMDGSLGLESRPGRTRFSLRLPVGDRAPAAVALTR